MGQHVLLTDRLHLGLAKGRTARYMSDGVPAAGTEVCYSVEIMGLVPAA